MQYRTLVIFLLLVLGVPSSAQITNVTDTTMTPMLGAGHDYIFGLGDIVNPANGSVSLRLDLGLPTARQLTIPVAVAYDSNVASAGSVGLLRRHGWTVTVPVLSAKWGQTTDKLGETCAYATGYIFSDSAGELHDLRLSFVPAPTSNACAQAPPPAQTSPTLTGGDDVVIATLDRSNVTVSTQNGTQYHYSLPQNTNQTVYALPTSIKDRNGNQITTATTGSSMSMTDTAGRAFTVSDMYLSQNANLTVSGFSQPYSLNWGPTGSTGGFNPNSVFVGPNNNGCGSLSGGPDVTDSAISIGLPNGQSYQFAYDGTVGLLSRITYPSGAVVTYTWGHNPQSEFKEYNWTVDLPPGIATCDVHYDTPAITKRTVSFDSVHVALEQDFSYQTTWDPNTTSRWFSWTTKQTTVTTKDCARASSCSVAPSHTTIYTYIPDGDPNNVVTYCQHLCSTYPNQIPVEQTIQYNDWGGGTTLRTVQKIFNFLHQPATVTTTEAGKVSETDFSYGTPPLSQITERDDYDWGSGAKGPLLKRTVFKYYDFSAWQIFDAVSQAITYDGNGNRLAETDYTYDQSAVGQVSATGHDDTNYGTGFNNRRNLTTKTQLCFIGSTACTNSVTTYTYDETGQVLSMTDPCGSGNGTCSDMTGNTHTTTYSYADRYTNGTPPANTNAYLTTLTRPAVNGVTTHGYYQYDYPSGHLTVSQDDNDLANGTNTSYAYADPLLRPTQINYPGGGQTLLSYNDTAPNPSVTTCRLINGTAGVTCSASTPPAGWATSATIMDGIGHVVQTKLASDPDGVTYTATIYDGLGRPYQTYNPTRCSTPTTNCGETTWGVTTHIYDALGRTKTVTEQDGSGVSTAYDISKTDSLGRVSNCTNVTDEVTNQRMSCSDGLGRLTSVWEAPNNQNYETDYIYDSLNNLTSVTQNGNNSANARVRSFVYDSLSRLTSATNPESGTITYTYDANGNLSSKVTPRPGQTGTATVSTTYTYDALNRLTGKTYMPGLSTGISLYGYDGTTLTGCGAAVPTINSPTNLIGRQSSMCGGKSASSWSYDPMGRPLIEARRNIGSSVKAYNISYAYNQDGSLKTLTYPSGDVLTYTVGGAGRATQAIDSSNNYVSSATYVPHGAPWVVTSGAAPISNGIAYNNRLQPYAMGAGIPSGSTRVVFFGLCDDFHLGTGSQQGCSFNPSTTGDNGNLFQVVDGVDSTRSAVFTYDPLNRISQANTITTTGANCWGEVYTIDPWGNLTNRSGPSGMTGCATEGLNVSASTKNQLSGISYDAAGNVTNDGNGNQPTYDGENRVVTDAGFTYYYDANGVRMEKASGTSGTMYWPGSGGKYLAESDLTGTINAEYIYFNGERIARVDRPSGTVHYYFSDHLGSASVITDAVGNVQQRYYYYPYGGTVASIGSDPNHYKFTGKERDSESGLDNFGARYNASTMGRFMTPDPSNLGVDFFLPQTWNRYAYALNNPTTMLDRNGLWPTWVHNDIIDQAFPTLSSEQRDILKTASAQVDSDQSLAGSYKHGMANGDQVNNAQSLAEGESHDFIEQNEHDAQELQQQWIASGHTGLCPAALQAFGNALHTITDKTSPSHEGYQRWYGVKDPLAWPGDAWHFLREACPGSVCTGNRQRQQNAINRAQFAFWLVFGNTQQDNPTVTVTVTNCVTDSNGKKVCDNQ